jgi:RNA polymerase primary sigma factor
MKRSNRTRSTALSDYLGELDSTPLMTSEDEQECAALVATGDREARDIMVRSNLRLVIALSRGYLRRGLSLEDLVAEGNLGLVRAVEGYDPSMGTRFSTYAAYWIKQSMQAAVIRLGKFVRLPAHAHTLLNKWRRIVAGLTEQLGRAPTFDEINDVMRLTERRRRLLAEAVQAFQLSPCRNDDGDGSAEAVLARACSTYGSPEEIVVRAEVFERLKLLDDRQALVVRLRFGLECARSLSLREIGERLGGIPPARVRQMESQALRVLSGDLIDSDGPPMRISRSETLTSNREASLNAASFHGEPGRLMWNTRQTEMAPSGSRRKYSQSMTGFH